MGEIERIADQLKRAYEGEAWHGPSVREVLDGATAAIAARRPASGGHSIGELAGHIGAWADIVRRRLLDETVVVTEELNFPPFSEASEMAWRQTLELLAARHHSLLDLIHTLSDDVLDKPQGQSRVSVYAILHGVVQHHIYHAGQIAILRKS